jgi:hypothetical protein
MVVTAIHRKNKLPPGKLILKKILKIKNFKKINL